MNVVVFTRGESREACVDGIAFIAERCAMSDRPTLCIVVPHIPFDRRSIREHIADGTLVPVERCEHGLIDPHAIRLDQSWCLGSPTLREADDG